MKKLFLIALLFTTNALADDCREESLVRFFTDGKEVESQLIGADDPCDKFGGNLIYTPKHNLFLYVNFNIAGAIDLDQYEAAFESGGAKKELREIKVALVDRGWIKRMYNDPRDAVLNMAGDTLFVSEVVLEEKRLIELMREFYSSRR